MKSIFVNILVITMILLLWFDKLNSFEGIFSKEEIKELALSICKASYLQYKLNDLHLRYSFDTYKILNKNNKDIKEEIEDDNQFVAPDSVRFEWKKDRIKEFNDLVSINKKKFIIEEYDSLVNPWFWELFIFNIFVYNENYDTNYIGPSITQFTIGIDKTGTIFLLKYFDKNDFDKLYLKYTYSNMDEGTIKSFISLYLHINGYPRDCLILTEEETNDPIVSGLKPIQIIPSVDKKHLFKVHVFSKILDHYGYLTVMNHWFEFNGTSFKYTEDCFFSKKIRK